MNLIHPGSTLLDKLIPNAKTNDILGRVHTTVDSEIRTHEFRYQLKLELNLI